MVFFFYINGCQKLSFMWILPFVLTFFINGNIFYISNFKRLRQSINETKSVWKCLHNYRKKWNKRQIYFGRHAVVNSNFIY